MSSILFIISGYSKFLVNNNTSIHSYQQQQLQNILLVYFLSTIIFLTFFFPSHFHKLHTYFLSCIFHQPTITIFPQYCISYFLFIFPFSHRSFHHNKHKHNIYCHFTYQAFFYYRLASFLCMYIQTFSQHIHPPLTICYKLH